ncbi:outer membrane protein with beta-barrel domain [Larkinella arboricola]|uniref:Outer membrane protein with beta-barrel domain n=1 Tax=Larkinella arboricola TaxID=643671 RepID=A0A327WU47_LARAB|nr:porin family protein [Larkinella arboricola]RAJ96053.1 outer membrane protein with beta-barrel domain [Larkinella arboricola]
MKKLLLLGLVLCLPVLTFAQFSIGVKGGVNLSQFTMGEFVKTRLNANGTPQVSVSGRTIRDNLKESFDSRTGWAYGIYTRFGKNIYLQPELLVSSKGGSFEIVRDIDGQPTSETVTINTTNFDVPILLGLKGGPIRVVAGPIVSFRISDDQSLRDALQDYTSGSLNNALAKATYGYQVGVGLDLGRLGIDVRREGGLSNVSAVDLGTEGNSERFSQKLKSWQVTLALRLF